MTMRRVILIVGAPGSGKTTLAKRLTPRRLERERYPSDHAFRAAVTRACADPDADLAVIRCCPTPAEQAEWEALTQATEVIVMPTSKATCIRRVTARARPRWRGEIAAIDHWFASRPDAHPAQSRRSEA